MDGYWLRERSGDTSVVFVHGILSSGETCWRHQNGAFWPELLAAETKLQSLGIYVFTYQTGLFSGSYSISDIVDALKEQLRIHRVSNSSRIIFVCHSMGGLVVRKYIVERAIDLATTKIGLFLVASPSLGSSYADWLSPIAQFAGHSQADALRFVRNNPWLKDLDKEFINLKEGKKLHIFGKELVEDRFIVLPAIIRRQVVEPFAGAIFFGEQFRVPGSNHHSIAKPVDADAIQHRLLVAFLEDVIDGQKDTNGLFKLSLMETEVEAFPYSPNTALLRFSITNLTPHQAKIKQLRLTVNNRVPFKKFRLPRPGAPISEYELVADITSSEAVDLLAGVRTQFITKSNESEAFSLEVNGEQGFQYLVRLDCVMETLAQKREEYSVSAEALLLYPIRTGPRIEP